MVSKSKALIAISFLVMPLAADGKDGGVRVEYSPAYLKNFALSTCIADGYESDEVMKDSLAVAGGYLELGHLALEAYEEAASLSRKFLTKQYEGKSGQRLILMKCIDLFHSKELEQLAEKYGRK